MTFKSFDELFDEILTDYKNQFPGADTSKGSLIFIKSACLASARWGLAQKVLWALKQIFPHLADEDYLRLHAWAEGVTVQPDDSLADILDKVMDRRQNPPAGGTKADYIRWAGEILNVKKGYCYPSAMGLGTVVMLILADAVATDSEIPADHADITGSNDSVVAFKLAHSTQTFITKGVKKGALVTNDTSGTEARVTALDSESQLALDADIFTASGQDYTVRSLCEEVRLHLEAEQAVQAEGGVTAMAPGVNTQDVTMSITGGDKAATKADIEAYMNALAPDKTLYLDQLRSIAINNGAESTNITAPAADVVPANYEMIRPGVVSVT